MAKNPQHGTGSLGEVMDEVKIEDPILVARNIEKAFGPHRVLRGLGLECRRHERLSLLGRSGSGKTTLLRILAGLDRPGSGEVLVDGRNILSYNRSDWPVGMVFQKPAVYPHMTVAQNLAFPLRARGRFGSDAQARVTEVAELVGVGRLLERGARDLSGGEAQRVALGKSIVFAPAVLLLDEPLSSVDLVNKWELLRMLKRVHEAEGKAMILVTHDSSEARYFADRIVVLADGSCGEPVSPDADPASSASLSSLRALAHPPANEWVLPRIRQEGAVAVYSEGEDSIRIELRSQNCPNAIVLAWLAHDGIASDSSAIEDHVQIMDVEEVRTVGLAASRRLYELTGRAGSARFITLVDGSSPPCVSSVLSVRRDRLTVFDAGSGVRCDGWSVVSAHAEEGRGKTA
jgi:multiple sugar transport system ATP-binding protein